MSDLIVIEANRPEAHYWLELWRYRANCFRVLAWRGSVSSLQADCDRRSFGPLIRPFLLR